MGTRGHIVYETPEGNYLMRTHKSDSYINKPGLGETLLHSMQKEKDIQALFDLNMDFSTISETEERYKEKEAISIKANGIKKHNDFANSTFDQLVFIQNRAIKCINFLDNKTPQDLLFSNIEDCLKQCTESYVYLYKQSDKKWFIQVENDFLDLKSAFYIDKKIFDIKWCEELESEYNKMAAPNYLPKVVSYGSGPVPLDNIIMTKLEFKKFKISDQILNFAENHTNQAAIKMLEDKYPLNDLKNMQNKYHLYLLNKKLHKTVETKSEPSKKLKI